MAYRRTTRLTLLTPVAGVAAWGALREPGGDAGALAAAGVALVLGPLILLALVFFAPAMAGTLVPRRMRMWWRRGELHRPSIPAVLRRAVLAADRYHCVWCGSAWQLQLDHIRPWSCGGLSSLWNLAVLCGRCNRVKSNYWVWQSGRVTYRAFAGSDSQRLAAQILAAERRARCNPLRWLRAAYAAL
jgi:HNH endonuclease